MRLEPKDPSLWERVDAALHEALSHEPPERDKFVAAIADPELRAEVESLLAADGGGLDAQMEQAIAGLAGRLVEGGDGYALQSEISHYRLLELIATGGMSEVYLAEDLQLGRKVALKLLPLAFSGDQEWIRRFEQEARAVSALNHPNILTIFETGHVGGRRFIAMEYVAGEPLSHRLRRGPLPVLGALAVAEQVATALSAAHELGVLHRDVKPANIMLRDDGLVKLVDFGVARVSEPTHRIGPVTAPTAAGLVLGTPSYMSPEQARGLPVDCGTDLWSLGAVLYEMVTGTRAFPGDNTPDILVAVLDRQPEPPSKNNPAIPKALEDLILRLLSRDVTRRYASAARVRDELQVIRSGLSVERPRRKSRLLLAAAGFAILAIAVAAWYRPRSDLSFTQLTTTVAANRATAAGFSPDGTAFAWTEFDGPLFMRRLESGVTTTFELPPDWSVTAISWNSVASKMLLSGYSAKTFQRDIRMLELASGTVTMVRTDAKSGVFSPDAAAIAFTNGAGSEAWVADANGGSARKVLAADSSDTFPLLFWSSPRTLSYQRRHFSPKQGRPAEATELDSDFEHSYGAIDASSAHLLLAEVPVPAMYGACALSGGRILFVARSPGRDFARHLWIAQTDSRTGAIASSPRQVSHLPTPLMTGLSCSANGDAAGVMLQSARSAVHVADVRPQAPMLVNVHPLTLDLRAHYPQSWSVDSSTVYFEMGVRAGTKDIGQWDIYRQALSERAAHPLATTPLTEYSPIPSPDGNWVLFLSYDEKLGRKARRLMRVPASGGEAVEVLPAGSFDEFRCASSAARCVVRVAGNKQSVYFELDPVRGRGGELLRTAWTAGLQGDWALSSDGSKIAVPNHDPKSAVIHIARLDARGPGPAEWDFVVPGLANLRGLRWAPPGDQGWFASVTIPKGVALIYVDRQGKFQTLRESGNPTWAVPSPDGRRLAFVDDDIQSNFWQVKGL